MRLISALTAVFLLSFLSMHRPDSASAAGGHSPHPHLVALNVASADRSAKWYGDNLGFAVKDRKEFPKFGLRIVMLELDGFWLEVVEKKNGIPVSQIEKAMPEIKDWDEVQGIKKLAFEVDDLDGYLKSFKQNGVRFQLNPRGGPEDPIFGRSFIVLDDDGNWIQLCQLSSGNRK